MRIIAGTARGTVIDAPLGRDTRPTLDRVRENVFNILQQQAAAVFHPQLAAVRFLHLMRLFVHIHQHGGCSPPADRLKRHCAAA